jgi:hypothetical protein
MARRKGRGSWSMPMAKSTRASGAPTRRRAEEPRNSPIGPSTWASTRTASPTAREGTAGHQGRNTRASGETEKDMEVAPGTQQMEIFIKEIGALGNPKVLASTTRQIETHTRESSRNL